VSDKVRVDAVVELPPSADSPRAARKFITDVGTAAGLAADPVETAALLTSELVTNAVLHGRTRCVLQVHCPPPYLRVSVADDNPRLPDTSHNPALTSDSGRGLQIVAALAPRWGIERTQSGGKAVWFELDLDQRPQAAGEIHLDLPADAQAAPGFRTMAIG